MKSQTGLSSLRVSCKRALRPMQDERSESSHEASHVNKPFLHGGGCETNKIIKNQVNEFIRVKTVIILSSPNKKIIFVVFYVKDVNKSYNYNTITVP